MNHLNKIENIETLLSTPKMARFPEFLARRVGSFYGDRIEKTWSGRHILQGEKPGRNSVMICHNDYLDLSREPRVVTAQIRAMKAAGNGLMMSAIFQQGMTPQRVFEQRLARHMRAPDGILTQSGWCANIGLVQTVATEGTPVYIDMLAHRSLWEGIRSAGATVVPCYHNDMDHMRRQTLRYGPGVILVDSVYSSQGSICPLVELVKIGEESGSVIIVDESHSLGTHGASGEGLVAALGLTGRVHFVTASLAKAFAGRGGFIACPSTFRDYFGFTSFPAIFSSCVLPSEIAGFDAVLDRIQQDAWRRTRLHEVAARLRHGLDELGYNVDDSQSQIIALEAGPEPATMHLRDAMERHDIFGAIFCAPATPKNRSLLRLSLNCALSDEDMERILKAAAAIRTEVNLADWPSTRRKDRQPRARLLKAA